MIKNKRIGISLIVLVITIIVVIILAAAVIISLQNNNPMEEANRARYQSDLANMQMIFVNTAGKIMAEKQEVIAIKGGQLNQVTSEVKETIGEVVYKINNEEAGKIIFTSEKNEDKNNYITGKKLPIYSSKTIWSIDDDGILKLQVGNKKYNDDGSGNEGNNNTTEDITQTGTVSQEAYNEILKRLEALENKEDVAVEAKAVPAGTVISYMGNKSPEGYLFCDGKEYNIADYKELAEQIKTEFGKFDYYGGNGTTTFAVPDLKGEFLRGTGSNSHSNSGNGAAVGVHQEPTSLPYLYVYNNGAVYFKRNISGESNTTKNYDTVVQGPAKSSELSLRQAVYNDTTASISTTSRPTNTSVLYCIKY